MKMLCKVVTFHKYKDLCTLNNYSGDETLDPVLCDFICWTFRTNGDSPVLKPSPTTP